MNKKFISMVFALCLGVLLVPAQANAADTAPADEELADIAEMVPFVLGEDGYKEFTKLDGDILIESPQTDTDATEHQAVKEVNAKDKIALTGELDVSKIGNLFSGMSTEVGDQDEDDYPTKSYVTVLDFSRIQRLSSTFTAKLTLPEGMMFSEPLTKDNVMLKNANGIFLVAEDPIVNAAERSVEVKMVFSDPVYQEKEFYTLKDLGDALSKVENKLQVTIPGITFDPKLVENKDYRVIGQLSGDFHAGRVSAAHYDPRMRTLHQEYLNNPDKLHADGKQFAPEKYNLFVEEILTPYIEVVIPKVHETVADLKTLIEKPYNLKNFEFPTDVYEFVKNRLYNKIRQVDGHINQEYNPRMAYSLAGEINLAQIAYSDEKRLLEKKKDRTEAEETRLQELKSKLERLNVYASQKAKVEGTLENLWSQEYQLRDNFGEFLDYFALASLDQIEYKPENNGGSEYTLSNFHWTAVQSDAGRDAALENDTESITFTIRPKIKKPSSGSSSTERYIIDASAENGTINPEGSVPVLEGTNQDFTYQATEGYTLSKVLVDGKEMDIKTYLKNYLFENVRANHKIHVVFTKDGEPQPPVDPDDKDKPDGGKDKPGTNTPDKNNTVNPTPGIKVTPLAVTPSTPGQTTVKAQAVQTGNNKPFGALIVLMGLAFGAMVLVRRSYR